jgi:hypothetical protein
LVEMFHDLSSLLRWSDGVSAAAPQDLCGKAPAFGAYCSKQVRWFDARLAGIALGQTDDLTHARRHEDPFPEPVFSCAQVTPDVRMELARVDTVGVQIAEDLRIPFFEQGYHQVLCTDVVVIMIAALLLGRAQHAQRCRTESLEQRQP